MSPILVYARAMKIFNAVILARFSVCFRAFLAYEIAVIVLPVLYSISAKAINRSISTSIYMFDKFCAYYGI